MYNNRQNKNNIMTTDAIMKMKDGMLRELTGNILPFWMKKMEDRTHGGFLGRISGKGEKREPPRRAAPGLEILDQPCWASTC